MNTYDLREAQARYENQIEDITRERRDMHKLRTSFVKYFDINRISNMGIKDYVAGVELPKRGYNFCYTLERKLGGLGSISGSPAPKFGVYFGKRGSKSKSEYQFVKKFGQTYLEAFEMVRKSILELLTAGRAENIELIIRNRISSMVKGKILCTYFPNRYLNIFSPDHLDFFLKKLDLDTSNLKSMDPVIKRERLINFKNTDPVMKNWSVDLFSHFLYSEYPGTPPKTGYNSPLKSGTLDDYLSPDFPASPEAEFINLEIRPPIDERTKKQKGIESSYSVVHDFEKHAKKCRLLGDRGEKIVLDLEIKRLQEQGRHDLAKQVERVSLKSDSYGYDVRSFELDGEEKFIEVKATQAKVGSANFFFTANEFRVAKESKNYYIYMVYDVGSKTPKVWPIRNPFSPLIDSAVMLPTNFAVTINAGN